MPDRPNRDADQLDAYLNGDSAEGDYDDLTAFAGRLVRQGSLRDIGSPPPSPEQVDRIRDLVFGRTTEAGRGKAAMTTHIFNANGLEPAPPIVRIEPARSTPASPLSILTMAALIALIAVAGFGAYRGSLDFLPGGGAPDTRQAPGIAPSPQVTPSDIKGCTLDEQISVFEDTVPNVVGLDTAVRVDDDGTMTLVCDGQETEIANGVHDAAPMLWPGVIAFSLENETVRLQNLRNGASLDLEPRVGLTHDGKLDLAGAFYRSGGAEPWLITPIDVDRSGWRVTDLRSMETLVIPKEDVPVNTEPTFEQVTGTNVAVVIWRSDHYLNQPATPFSGGRQFAPEQRALVLPGSVGDHRWIDINEYRDYAAMRGLGFSQPFAVSPDGSSIAYTAVHEGTPVVRIEASVDGARIVDVPLDSLDRHTRFFVSDGAEHLVASDGEHIRIHRIQEGEPELLSEQRFFSAWWFYPTRDPHTILVSHNSAGTSVTPLDVTTGEMQERYQYIAPIVSQLYGDVELPRTIVRISSDGSSGDTSVLQLVNPVTGEVVLESEPVAAHPVQIISFYTSLRNGGTLAVVPIGFNRAVGMDLTSGRTWQIEAPIDDDRLWRFSLGSDGSLLAAWPDPATGTSEYVDGHVAPFEPGTTWIPVAGRQSGDTMVMDEGTAVS